MANTRKSPRTDAGQVLASAVAVCLERCLPSGQRIVLGLSGGVDSVVLLHVLTGLLRTAPQRFKLAAIHVHHGLSPNADRWESFCRRYCAALNVEFSCRHVSVERGSKDGLEAAARRARHAVFAAAEADWVLLAQHRDDQAETLLFNLLRGCGLAGAAAMRERNGHLLRPLLSIGREEIENYALAHRLEWVEDESNADIHHARNFLRRKILPELRGRFPAAAKNLAGAAARFAEARELLDDLARSDLGPITDFPLDVALLDALGEARARNVLRHLLARRQVMIPSEARLLEALRQMCQAAADRHPALVFGSHRLLRRRGLIYLEPVVPVTDGDGGGGDDNC